MPIPDKEERARRAAACRQTIELERRRRRGKTGALEQTRSSELPADAARKAPDEQTKSYRL